MPNPPGSNNQVGIVLDNPNLAYGVADSESPQLFSGSHGLGDGWNFTLGEVADQIIYISKGARASDVNDGISVATPLSTIAAANTLAATFPGETQIQLGHGDWAENVSVITDYTSYRGLGPESTRIVFTGTGVGFDGNVVGGATIRRGLQVSDLEINGTGASAGAIAARLDNVYKSIWRNVFFNLGGTGGVNGTALKLIGGTGKSCYLNEFYSCTYMSDGIIFDIGNGCNENKWFGGYVTGGANVKVIQCDPTINDSSNNVGECKWFGTVFEGNGTTFGTCGASTGLVKHFEFHGCRFEPNVSTTWTLSANVSGFLFMGGTRSNQLTITDNGTLNHQAFANDFNLGTFRGTVAIITSAIQMGTTNPSAAVGISINSAAAFNRYITFTTLAVNRWAMYANSTAEAGSDAGSDFTVDRYSDAGTLLASALTIRRSDGLVTIGTTRLDAVGRIGQGVAVSAQTMNLLLGGNAHPGTNATLYGYVSQPKYPATTTTEATNYYSQLQTAAAAFTIPDGHGYLARPPSLGASSTITTLSGFRAENQGNAAVTNAYGVKVDAQSGAATLNIGASFGGGTQGNVWLNSDVASGAGGIVAGTTRDLNLYRRAANEWKTDDKLIAALGIGVGNSAAATTPGSVVKKAEVFDGSGASLGFVPIYDAIT